MKKYWYQELEDRKNGPMRTRRQLWAKKVVPQELEDSLEMKKKLVSRTRRQRGDKKSWYQELEDRVGDEKMWF